MAERKKKKFTGASVDLSKELEKNGRGAPRKRVTEKILKNHLRPDQVKWAKGEAEARNVPMWSFIRQVIDLGRTIMDQKRGNVSASALFDDIYDETKKGAT